jgi:hypothetical protein
MRSVDQPPMYCTMRSEVPGGHHRRHAGVAQDVVRDAFQADAPHQAAKRHADGLLARRPPLLALAEDGLRPLWPGLWCVVTRNRVD